MEGRWWVHGEQKTSLQNRACCKDAAMKKDCPGYEKGLILRRERSVGDNVNKPALGIDCKRIWAHFHTNFNGKNESLFSSHDYYYTLTNLNVMPIDPINPHHEVIHVGTVLTSLLISLKPIFNCTYDNI